MSIINHKMQGAKAPIIIYNGVKLTGNEWFQWYKQYLKWLENMPIEKIRLLELMGLTEHYYLTYINPLTPKN